MRFEEIRIRGFLSYGEKEQVVKLGKRGLVLLEGRNGSGKSAIPDALLWCLFGTTTRGVTGDDVVNRRGKAGCKVSVSFSNDAGEVFLVERYRGDPAEKNKLYFTGPTGGLTKKDTTETEAQLREVLGLDFDSFTAAVVFGQGEEHFASLSDKEMKRITDKLIGVEAISEAGKLAHVARKELEDELGVLRGRLQDLEGLSQAVKLATRDRAAWEEAQAKKIQAREKEKKGLTKVDLAKYKERVEETTQAVYRIGQKTDVARETLASEKTKLELATQEHNRCLASVSGLRAGPGLCTHCGQQVSAQYLAEHRKELKAAVDAAKGPVEVASGRVDAARKLLAALKDEADSVRSAQASAQSLLQEQVVQAGKAAALQAEIERLTEEKNPHGKAVRRAEEALATATDENDLTNRAIAAATKEHRVVDFVDVMFSDRGGATPPLKSLLVESVAPFLNKQLRRYSRRLTDGNVEIRFNTQTQLKSGEYRDSYAIEAVDRFGAAAYAGSSAGEKRKTDVAIFFALQDLAASRSREQVRLLIADEVFDALDGTAQEVMVELLLEERSKRDTILVITHREDMKAFFPQRVKVVKEGGTSRIAS